MAWRDWLAPASAGGAVDTGVRVTVEELIRLRLKARGLYLGEARQARSAGAGLHGSRFRGRGIDFQESRAYQPGDDIRNMDWRVTARSGRPHTKLYREERERPVILLVDCNPSMFFGTRHAFKSVTAARAAALLAWATVAHGDRVGGFLFGGAEHQELRPTAGRRGALALLRALAAWTDPRRGMARDGSFGLGEALKRLRRVARPGSLVVMLSDFYALDPDSELHLSRLRPHSDFLAVQIADALELEPPPPGRYGITDGQALGVLDTRSGEGRRAYEQHFAGHHRRVRELTRRYNIPLIALGTFEDPVVLARKLAGARRQGR